MFLSISSWNWADWVFTSLYFDYWNHSKEVYSYRDIRKYHLWL